MGSFSSIAPYFNSIFPYRPAKGNFIETFLTTKPSQLLDIGCATGTLAIDLAQRGHFATGIDLDKDMIAIARANAGDSGADFEVMDMIHVDEVFGLSQFHLVSCLGNTVVQLDSLEKILSLLTKVMNILKPDGTFIVQNVNYDKILDSRIGSLPTIENQELVFFRNYEFHANSNLVEFRTKIIDKIHPKEIENTTFLYPLRSEEFKELLQHVGLQKYDFYGDFDRKAFEKNSPALIVVTSK